MTANLNLPNQRPVAANAKNFAEAFQVLLSSRSGFLAAESGGELSWLRHARESEARRWLESGLPDRREERWRYTNLSTVGEARILAQAEISSRPERRSFPALNVGKAWELCFLNGRFVPEWSKLPEKGSGLTVLMLSEIFNECVAKGWTADHMAQLAKIRSKVESAWGESSKASAFAAMNTSFLQEFVYLGVEPGCRLDRPVLVTHFQTPSAAPDSGSVSLVTPRLFVEMSAGSDAQLIQFFSGAKDDHSDSKDGATGRCFTNSLSDFQLAEGARLLHCKVQVESATASHMATTRVQQGRTSRVETYNFAMGAMTSRDDLHIRLEGEGAEVVLDGLSLANGKRHIDHYTHVEHVVPHTSSEQLYKSILADDSRAVFNGHIHIHQNAQKSQAAQLNKNLLLSSRAEIDAKPELEIEADDVKASHGATIGQLDPEQVFYFQTRAVSKSEATAILAKGFAHDIAYRMREGAVRDGVIEAINRQIASWDLSGNLGGAR